MPSNFHRLTWKFIRPYRLPLFNLKYKRKVWKNICMQMNWAIACVLPQMSFPIPGVSLVYQCVCAWCPMYVYQNDCKVWHHLGKLPAAVEVKCSSNDHHQTHIHILLATPEPLDFGTWGEARFACKSIYVVRLLPQQMALFPNLNLHQEPQMKMTTNNLGTIGAKAERLCYYLYGILPTI